MSLFARVEQFFVVKLCLGLDFELQPSTVVLGILCVDLIVINATVEVNKKRDELRALMELLLDLDLAVAKS